MYGETLHPMVLDARQAHLIANRSRHVVSFGQAKLRGHPA